MNVRPRTPAKLRVFLAVAVIAVSLDQASKLWIDVSLGVGDRITVLEGAFYITHVRNPGAAFGLLAGGSDAIRRVFFAVVAVVAAVVIASFYRHLAPGDRASALGLGLILGGASGNLVDRVWRGEVIDFLRFHLFSGLTWPDFNLADSFIVVGVALLVVQLMAGEAERRAGEGGVKADS